MLLSVTIQNCLSIGNELTLSFVAGAFRETAIRKKQHIISSGGVNALRLTAFYGANATGKSNILHAIRLAITCLSKNSCMGLANKQFKLFQSQASEVISFGFTFVKGKKYTYEFSTNGQRVLSEKLIWEKSGASPARVVLFERKADAQKVLGELLKDEWYQWRTLEPHMFYLSKLKADGIYQARPKGAMHIIAALDFFESFFIWENATLSRSWMRDIPPLIFADQTGFIPFLKHLLVTADVGISDLIQEPLSKMDIESMMPLLPAMTHSQTVAIFSYQPLRYLTFQRDEESQTIKGTLLKTLHNGVPFELGMESLGTQKIFAMGAALWKMLQEDRVVLADELDSSLHPLLFRALVKQILGAAKTHFQLIFTAHCTALLDQSIVRRDEIWLTEKDARGNTDAYPLTRFTPRNDKSLEKGYLQGLYGAVPMLGSFFEEEGQ